MARSRSSKAFVAIIGTIIFVHVWRIQDVYPFLGALQLPILSMVLGIGWFVSDGGMNRVQAVFRHPTMRAVLILAALVAIGLPFGLYPRRTFNFLTNQYLQMIIVTVIIAGGVRSFRDVERLSLVMLAGTIFYCLLAFTRFEMGADGRLGNMVYYDSNDLGMLLVMMLPLAVYWVRSSPRLTIQNRLVGLAAVVLIASTIARTGSRGGFLGLIAVSVYLLFRFRAVKASVRLGSVLGAFVILAAVGGDRYWEMMGTLLNPSTDYNWAGGSDTGRIEIWKRGIGYMLSNPILGVGATNFGIAEGKLSSQAALQVFGIGFKWSAPHNSFVEVGAEVGVVGLIVFLWILISAVRSMTRLSRDTSGSQDDWSSRVALGQAYVGSIIGYSVAGFFLTQAFAAALYVVLASIVGLSLLSRRSPAKRVVSVASVHESARSPLARA